MFGKNSGVLDGAALADQQQKFAALAELHQEITELTAELDSLKNVPLTEGITEVESRSVAKVIPLPTEDSLQEAISFAYDTELLRLEDEIQHLRQADAEKAAMIQKLEYQLQEAVKHGEYLEDELAEAQLPQEVSALQPQVLVAKMAEIDELQGQLTSLLTAMKGAERSTKQEAQAAAESITAEAQSEAQRLIAASEVEIAQHRAELAAEKAAAEATIQTQQQKAAEQAANLLELAEVKADGIINEAREKAKLLDDDMKAAIQEFRQQTASLNQRLATLKAASGAAFDELMVKGQQLTVPDWKGDSIDADH